MKGAKRTPTAIRKKMGNPGKRPMPVWEPTPPDEMPEAPPQLDDYAKEEWDRLAPIAFNMGVLTVADVGVFSAYCVAYSRWRRAEEGIKAMATDENLHGLLDFKHTGTAYQNPLLKISEKAAHDMLKYAVEMGLTAAARARLAVYPPKEKKSKYDGLIKVVA